MKSILVTGTEGFIGGEVAKSLALKGHLVIGLDSKPGKRFAPSVVADISSTNLKELLETYNFESIIHCAAQTDVRISTEDPFSDLLVNGFGTLSLVKYAEYAGIESFIYINSGGAIYANDEIPLNEKSRIGPASPYGLSKYVGEEYLRILTGKSGIKWSSLALSNVYGDITQNGKGVIYEFAKAIKGKTPPIIYGLEVTRDFIHINDVVAAVNLSLNKPTNERLNISSDIETSIYEIYNMVAAQLNYEKPPQIEAPRFGEITRSRLDNSRAREQIGWLPTIDIISGIRDSLKNVNDETTF